MKTEYTNNGTVKFTANGAAKIAFRIPSWCESYTISKPYTLKNGYAIVENDGSETVVDFAITVKAIHSDPRVIKNAGRICFMRGPIVYCAEAVDNLNGLHSYRVSPNAKVTESYDEAFGLMTLELDANRLVNLDGDLYSSVAPKVENAVLKLIPYSCFANRGGSDMLVWLLRD